MNRIQTFLTITVIAVFIYSTSRLVKSFIKKDVAVVQNTDAANVILSLPIVRLTDGGRTYCSGVVIDKNTIVTASHCVIQCDPMFGMCRLNPEPINIRDNTNVDRNIYGRVKSAMQQLDRAIIKGDFSMFKPAPYISDVAEFVKLRVPGLKMYACGYPLGGNLFCSPITYVRGMGFFLLVDGVLIPGMSGGPTVLLDGTVVAINVAVEDDMSVISPIYNIDMMK